MKTMLFIMNPFAGQKRANRVLPDILLLFSQAGYDIHTVMTTGTGAATRAAQSQGGDVDLVVCCGGDGTLNETITGLLRAGVQTPLGYIPTGTTNDFAASLGLSHNPVQAAKDILEGEVHAYDAGRFGERYFSYVASFGAFTRSSYIVPQNIKNALGHTAYVLGGISELSQIRNEHIRMDIDGEIVEDDFLFGAICNSTSVGGFKGMTGKDVLLDDGVFEVTLIKKPKNPIELNEIIASLINLVDDTDMIYSFKTSEVRFTAKNTIPWTLDGEFGGDHEEVVVKNLCRAVEIMVPQGE